ncbi:hypothetical protein WA026_017402, partial [Henosepilachna vigintioctopunctata]
FHKQMMELSMLFSKLQNWMNPKFSRLTSSPSSPPEQEQQKQCFLVRIHDSTVVENQLLEQLGINCSSSWERSSSSQQPTAQAVDANRSSGPCISLSL